MNKEQVIDANPSWAGVLSSLNKLGKFPAAMVLLATPCPNCLHPQIACVRDQELRDFQGLGVERPVIRICDVCGTKIESDEDSVILYDGVNYGSAKGRAPAHQGL